MYLIWDRDVLGFSIILVLVFKFLICMNDIILIIKILYFYGYKKMLWNEEIVWKNDF